MSQAFATVQRIESIRPHPDETRTRIEVIKLGSGVELVTGKHYRVGLLGIFLRAGCLIPGWLAEDLWLVGKKRAGVAFEVRFINIFGVESPGLFCGAEYMADGTEASAERYRKLEADGGKTHREKSLPLFDWITWPRWRSHWQVGQELDGYLGIVPSAMPATWVGGFPHSAGPSASFVGNTGGSASVGALGVSRAGQERLTYADEPSAITSVEIFPRDLDETPDRTVPRD